MTTTDVSLYIVATIAITLVFLRDCSVIKCFSTYAYYRNIINYTGNLFFGICVMMIVFYIGKDFLQSYVDVNDNVYIALAAVIAGFSNKLGYFIMNDLPKVISKGVR